MLQKRSCAGRNELLAADKERLEVLGLKTSKAVLLSVIQPLHSMAGAGEP